MSTIDAFLKLKDYCEKERYKGWDPYDGLNSKIFQSLPFLKNSALCRLVMIQGFKRSPVNLRRAAWVPKEYNAKGIGLFLQGYCNLYKTVIRNKEYERVFGATEQLESQITFLAELLISLRSQGYSGACWGYNFDWQARRLFCFPKYTPTVVANSFCATALLEASTLLNRPDWKEVALSSAYFVIEDLHRNDHCDGFLFSYSPLPGNDTVFNASLLGTRLLSFCGHYNYEARIVYNELARTSAIACCNSQKEDGSWVYGLLPVQSWVDSFHTGYNLDGLSAYEELTGDMSFHANIERGFDYYIRNFFEEDGCPKYYSNKKYPIDIHCPGQLLVTLARLHKTQDYLPMAEKVIEWTIRNMQDKRGYFYYQIKPALSSRIPYMRWSNAFMFYALSYFFFDTLN